MIIWSITKLPRVKFCITPQ